MTRLSVAGDLLGSSGDRRSVEVNDHALRTVMVSAGHFVMDGGGI